MKQNWFCARQSSLDEGERAERDQKNGKSLLQMKASTIFLDMGARLRKRI